MIIATFGFFKNRANDVLCPLSLHARDIVGKTCVRRLDCLMEPKSYIPESVSKRGYQWQEHKHAKPARDVIRVFEDFCRGESVYLLGYAKTKDALVAIQQRTGLTSQINYEPLSSLFSDRKANQSDLIYLRSRNVQLTMHAGADCDAISRFCQKHLKD